MYVIAIIFGDSYLLLVFYNKTSRMTFGKVLWKSELKLSCHLIYDFCFDWERNQRNLNQVQRT